MEEDLDKIARLVKPKEYILEQPTEGGVIGTEIGLTPTDSVTSDGTKAKEYKCLECGAEINEGESKTFGVCDECWDKAHPKLQPTESQDELFDIVRLRLWQIGELVPVQRDKEYKKLQSEFRIERI